MGTSVLTQENNGTTALYSAPAVSSARLLRLSVTERCNFHCHYCMPPGTPLRTSCPLPLSRLIKCVEWLKRYVPVSRIKLTGGEPLLRRGIEDLIECLHSLPGIEEISMTTNASLLARNVANLKQCGLSRVNISLDCLNPSRFAALTERKLLNATLAGIEAAVALGMCVKLNTVVHRSTWKEEVPRLLDFASERNLEIRFIELMRTGATNQWSDHEYISAGQVKNWLLRRAQSVQIETPVYVPSRQTLLFWKGTPMKVGWIAPRSHAFCAFCERLRLDSKGYLRRCLMDSRTLELTKLMNMYEPVASQRLYEYLATKRAPAEMATETPMNQIGG